MKRSKHSGEHPVNCPACITEAEKQDLFGRGYVYVLAQEHVGGAIARRHVAALRRNERERTMRDLGLVKVRGALGGTYWE